MGGSARFLLLLTSPYYPLLTPRPTLFLQIARNTRLLTSRLSSSNPSFAYSTLVPRPNYLAPIRAIQSESFHSQSNAFKDDSFIDQFGGSGSGSGGGVPNWYHPWPEWCRFVDYLRQGGYFERVECTAVNGDVWGFAAGENFASEEFYKAALACLEFARDRDNLLGYLPRGDIRVVVENGSTYLFRDQEMVRSRMKSFLGIAGGGVVNLERPTMVDLMKFLISAANIRPVSPADGYYSNEQIVVSSVRNLLSELAKLNFGEQSYSTGSMQNHYSDGYGQAPRQQIEMKRGDWICPKCTFMNFARNTKCLECEEARPRRQLTNGEWECPQCDFFNYGRNVVCLRCDCKRPGEVGISPAPFQSTNLNTSNTGFQQAANEKAQWWSGNGSQLNNSSDPNSRVDDEEFPEIMPLRKGVNRFVVSTRKTPLERRLANAQAQRDLVNNDASGGINNSNYAFVPLPPDMFAAKPQDGTNEARKNDTPDSTQGSAVSGSTFAAKEPDRSNEKLQLSERPVSLTEGRDNNDQVEKSERWFKRVSELHDVADLSSAIPDEDFPELMPMRKGENRFVVSKKKDRSLTTPVNKRRASMDQPNESKFVPFVPFPPDYFAKKDQPPSEDLKSSQKSSYEPQNFDNASGGMSSFGETKTYPDASNQSPALENSPQSNLGTNNTWSSIKTSGSDNQDLNGGHSGRSSSSQTNVIQNSSISSQKENTTYKDGWIGKSLEGSAVTEIDPLDMSEEAKAERWFRRAAQIKDISELSQIPDEDFPSIMPMRKGVNRFVVSKRKTPLERRLTSPQYRRNLPIIESDPSKTPNESS